MEKDHEFVPDILDLRYLRKMSRKVWPLQNLRHKFIEHQSVVCWDTAMRGYSFKKLNLDLR